MGGIVSGITGVVKNGTPWGAIATGVSTLYNIGSSIYSGIRANSLNKRINTLSQNRPKYKIPEEYQQILAQYQNAYRSDMPGYAQTLSNVGQAGARARGAAERGAISSNAYGAQVGDIYQKELDALQNLGIQQEQYKTAQLGNVAQAQGAVAGQKAEAWNLNENIPWQTQMNELTSQYGAAATNSANAGETAIAGLMNFAGTQYYNKMLQGMYPQNKGTGYPKLPERPTKETVGTISQTGRFGFS